MRAINLKIVVPRTPEARDLQQDLVFTGRMFDRAVKAWEKLYLELRQDDVQLHEDVTVNREGFRNLLRARFRGVNRELTEEDFKALKDYYRMCIRSYDAKKEGKAQQATGKMNAALSAESENGQREFWCIAYWGWLGREGSGCLTKQAAKELRKRRKKEGEKNPRVYRVPPEVRRRIDGIARSQPESVNPRGVRAAKWLKRRREDESDLEWYEMLLTTMETKVKEYEKGACIPLLNQYGLRPLIQRQIPLDDNNISSGWEFAVVESAASHLLSWESRRHLMTEERGEIEKEMRKAQEAGYFLETVELESAVGPVTFGDIRGWKKLREWALEGNPTEPERLEHLREEHEKDSSKYGNIVLMRRLLADDLIHLSLCEKGDTVTWLAEQESRRRKLEQRKELPTCYRSNERRLPTYDGQKSDNKPQLRFMVENKEVYVYLPLLRPIDNGKVKEIVHKVRLAKSKQLCELVLEDDAKGGSQHATRRSQDRLDLLTSEIKGSILNVEGDLTKKGKGTALLHVSLETAITEEFLARGRKRKFFSSSLIERKKLADPGAVRVLGVDLGIRNPVAASIYTRSADGRIEHERSVVLRLPGDRPSPREILRRAAALRAVRAVRRRINGLKNLCKEVEAGARDPADFYREEREVGKEVAEFRRQQQADRRDYKLSLNVSTEGWGLSMAYIEYLDETRKALVSWVNHHRPGEETQRGTRGGVAKSLLEHIRNVKVDRARKTADLIVQSANGRVYTPRNKERKGGWRQHSEPVDIIVLDGLKNYRTWKGYKPQENARLMKWCHRAVSEAAEFQAVEASIAQTDTRITYSSEFHARTRAPGMRCFPVTARALAGLRSRGKESWLWKVLTRDMKMSEEEVELLQEGDLVPSAWGATFMTLTKDGSVKLDADVNAAQNAALWYLEGHDKPMRVSGYLEKLSGDILVDTSGKRLKSAFSASGVAFAPTKKKNHYVQVNTWRSVAVMARSYNLAPEEVVRSSNEEEEEEQNAYRLSGTRKRLFIDRSGTFFPESEWIEAKHFWAEVHKRIMAAMADEIRSRRPGRAAR